jgi:hypothetical protein
VAVGSIGFVEYVRRAVVTGWESIQGRWSSVRKLLAALGVWVLLLGRPDWVGGAGSSAICGSSLWWCSSGSCVP